VRRSRRANKADVAAKARRTSGRNITRKNYVERFADEGFGSTTDEELEFRDEVEEVDKEEDEESDNENEDRENAAEDEDDSDDELDKTPAGMKMNRRVRNSRFALHVRIPSVALSTVKIPGGERRRSNLRITKRPPLRVLQVHDSEDEGSEDELSFGF
jgi:hypothetical protein